MLKSFTEELITSHDDLLTFALHLGFTYAMVQQARTNHPHSVERSALHLACMWWNQEKGPAVYKVKLLLQSVDALKKPWLKIRLSKITEASLT